MFQHRCLAKSKTRRSLTDGPCGSGCVRCGSALGRKEGINNATHCKLQWQHHHEHIQQSTCRERTKSESALLAASVPPFAYVELHARPLQVTLPTLDFAMAPVPCEEESCKESARKSRERRAPELSGGRLPGQISRRGLQWQTTRWPPNSRCCIQERRPPASCHAAKVGGLSPVAAGRLMPQDVARVRCFKGKCFLPVSATGCMMHLLPDLPPSLRTCSAK